MADATRLSYLAAGAGIVSLGVSVYVLSRTPEPAHECSCDDSAVKRELASLRRRVDVAERNATRHTVSRVARAAASDEREEDGDAAERTAGGEEEASGDEEQRALDAPRFVGFDVPHSSITVSQADSGALSVRNTDPSLVGEVLTVRGRTASGGEKDITITVPPAE